MSTILEIAEKGAFSLLRTVLMGMWGIGLIIRDIVIEITIHSSCYLEEELRSITYQRRYQEPATAAILEKHA